ncbi:hypothetical protein VTN77DRAFT_4304 [Rasamsonia byssochlamydoides]|uniref:uncharacterized protein n=1 Tax=Rasamsonia byssochlamydoides TaxID=89139 RepID=UPI003743A3F0
MAASAKEKKASRITTACNPCRSRKQKCSGERPACEQCLEYNRACAWPEQLKRGPAKGYIEALEHRLHETETVLLKILPHISQNLLASILSDVSASTASDDGGRPVYAPISPLRKRGVEYWKSFPLSSVENIRKWEQDCHALRRSRSSNISHYDADGIDSSAPSKRLKRFEGEGTSPSFDDRSPTTEPRHDSVDSRFASHSHRPYRSQQLDALQHMSPTHHAPPAEEDISSESTYDRHHHHHHIDRPEQQQQQQQQQQDRLSEEHRPLDAIADAAETGPGSYYVVDQNTLSQLAFLKGGGGFAAPSAPQELSSWDAAPPIKFQQQFLW